MSVFNSLYAYHFRNAISLTLLGYDKEIRKEADTTFKKPIVEHDRFFVNFTPIWQDYLIRYNYYEAESIWNYAINLTLDWERSNSNRVHKGTPYYFLGVTQILASKIDEGFFSMHQALEEDKLTHSRVDPQTPAYYFTLLDSSKPSQFFGPYVVQIAKFLEEKMDEYRKTIGGTLTLTDFRTKFLEASNLREEVFRFVYFLSKLKNQLQIPNHLRQNEFSSLEFAKLLFDICMISEKCIEEKNPRRGTTFLTFSHELTFLRRRGKLSHTDRQCKSIRDDLKTNFETTLDQLLNNTYHMGLTEIEYDYIITYYLRNFGAHNIINQPILNKEIQNITQRVLNTLFWTIEQIY